ncbi:MAG: hypothetical protein NZZ41_05665, partial [Candidatus Dojkabacteria bacterium]|nr:hypothetical protein [Candidatus Dojkabacteria bacterium]
RKPDGSLATTQQDILAACATSTPTPTPTPTPTSTPAPTPIPQITCYRCTPNLNDGNACESAVFQMSSCPTGWTNNPNCFQNESGGMCPTQTTCYQCTPQTGDGNACQPILVNGTTCPAGTSNSPNGCAQAVGGSCDPSVPVTCYRCTQSLLDGNACESFVASNTCPTGSTPNANQCFVVVGGYCPQNVTCNQECGNNRICVGDGIVCINGRCRLSSNPTSETCQPMTQSIMCYRCTPSLTDGNLCESISITGQTDCPSGWSTSSDCRLIHGGNCPQQIPSTAIFDNERANIILFGLSIILFGVIVYKYRIGKELVDAGLFRMYLGISLFSRTLTKVVSRNVIPYEHRIDKYMKKKK